MKGHGTMSNYTIQHDTIATTLRGLMPDEPSPRIVAYCLRKVMQLNQIETIHKAVHDRKRIARNLSRRQSAERIAS